MKKARDLIFIFILCLLTTGTAHAAEWKNDAKGWWYLRDDGSYPANEWSKIEGAWYHFDNMGYMQTGWIQDGGKYYCLNKGGDMLSNIWIDGKYYLGKDGAMLTNTYTPDGYKVNADGLWELKELAPALGTYYVTPKDPYAGRYITISMNTDGNYLFEYIYIGIYKPDAPHYGYNEPLIKDDRINAYYAYIPYYDFYYKITVLSDTYLMVEETRSGTKSWYRILK